MHEGPTRCGVGPGDAAGRGDRSRVDHRVRAAVLAPLDCFEGVERQPRRVGADVRPHRLGTEHVADEREDERLRDAHDRELVARVANGVECSARGGDRDPEAVRRCIAQRRVHRRGLSLRVRPEPLVRVVDERPHELGPGQLPGRDVGAQGASSVGASGSRRTPRAAGRRTLPPGRGPSPGSPIASPGGRATPGRAGSRAGTRRRRTASRSRSGRRRTAASSRRRCRCLRPCGSAA